VAIVPKVSLTEKFIAGIKPAASQIDYFDAKTKGLVFRVSPSGLKTWCAFYTSPKDGKRARSTLGHYPQTTLAEARARALEATGQVDEGIDPRDVGSGAMTVGQLATSYIGRHVRPNFRRWREKERRLTANVLPVIGSLKLSDLHRREVTKVMDRIMARGARAQAAKVFKDMNAMFRWAVARGDLEHSPTDGIRPPKEGAPRARVLTDAELRQLWNALPEALPRSNATQQIIKLCLLTGQRVGEVSGMHCNELDLRARTWTIPAARSKNGHAHEVPLSDAALTVIREAEDKDFIFPDRDGDAGLTSHEVSKTIRRAQSRFGLAQWIAHDLRRTVVTGMAGLGVSPLVLGHVVGHRSVTKAGVTLGVYNHYSYGAEKRDALELWANRLLGIVGGDAARVVRLKA
jgi:integrase